MRKLGRWQRVKLAVALSRHKKEYEKRRIWEELGETDFYSLVEEWRKYKGELHMGSM